MAAGADSRPCPDADAVRVGLVGCGRRGTALLSDLMARRHVRVAAVCDLGERRCVAAAAVSGARAFRHWEAVVDRRDVDAVVIATPDHWHAPMTLAAMDAGKSVYCERPLALALADAGSVRDRVARTGCIVQVGVTAASAGQWHAARDIVRGGGIGRVLWSQAGDGPWPSSPGLEEARTGGTEAAPSFPRPGRAEARSAVDRAIAWNAFAGDAAGPPFDADRYLNWRNYWEYSGGVATERLYDVLAPLLIALEPGLPFRVSAAGGISGSGGRETPDSLVVTIEYPHAHGGTHTVVVASSPAHRRPLPAVIRGDRAALYCEGDTVRIVPETGHPGCGDETRIPVPRRRNHLDDWLDCIRTRRPCACDPELAFRTTAALAMAVQAFRTSTTVCDAAFTACASR